MAGRTDSTERDDAKCDEDPPAGIGGRLEAPRGRGGRVFRAVWELLAKTPHLVYTPRTFAGLIRRWLNWILSSSRPEAYFERVYARTADPWNCETSSYERLKAERTKDAVVRLRPGGAVLDVGCGEGILADLLAQYGCRVHAYELSRSAAARAERRCAKHADVRIVHGDVARRPILFEGYDVIVLAEVFYYLSRGKKRRVICERLVEGTVDQGYVVAVNPWPAARSIERPLRLHRELTLLDRRVFPDRGRPYAITIYQRKIAWEASVSGVWGRARR